MITASAGKGSFKRMTDSEMRARREKGLCYKCDEKFSPGHRCKKKELQALMVTVIQEEENGGNHAETEIDESLDLANMEDGGEGIREEPLTKIAALSLNSLAGLGSPKTRRLSYGGR